MMFWHLSISDTHPMEIRDLRALLAVVQCGSFTAAAKELGYTQSAIAQQVAALELELGHQLVREPADIRVAVCPCCRPIIRCNAGSASTLTSSPLPRGSSPRPSLAVP